MKKYLLSGIVLTLLLTSVRTNAEARFPIRIISPLASHQSQISKTKQFEQKLVAGLASLFGSENLREVRARVVFNAQSRPDHVLVYLFSKQFHRFEYASVQVDSELNMHQVVRNYRLQRLDLNQQINITQDKVRCPDPSVQFLAACPNDDSLELNVTNEVAKAAQDKGLKTVVLLKSQVTSANYLNYMSCPNLIGNFYDGDANTGVLATNDGEITAAQFSTLLPGAFRNKVTNIWLACEAYNDPMLTAIRDTDQSQKYAAGINDLEIGPSDHTAACAMEAAIAGKKLTESFQECKKQNDNSSDQWGFGGAGADLLGQ